MATNNDALDAITEIIEDTCYSSDLGDNNVLDFTGQGTKKSFPIAIHEFHGIYWVSAAELDDVGYFTELSEDKEAADD